METINWTVVYKKEIAPKGEHNKHFTLEEFLSYTDSMKQLLRDSYSKTSLLNTINKQGSVFHMPKEKDIPACKEDSCELVDEFLKSK
jgi:hypothetical protein